MSRDDLDVDVHTIHGHRGPDGRLESVAATVGLVEPDGETRVRVHYEVDDGVARLDHFVVGDDFSVFAVADLRCVPIAERAIRVVPGVDEVEPAEETFDRTLREGRELG